MNDRHITRVTWTADLTTALIIGLICGLIDATCLQFKWLVTDKVHYVPARVWLVCPVAWATACLIAVAVPLLLKRRALALAVVMLVGPGALSLARLVAAVRYVSPSWRAYGLPLAIWAVAMVLLVWMAVRLSSRVSIAPARRPLLVAVWMVFAGACSALPLWHRSIPSARQTIHARPNVVLIFLDTLRQDYSGLDGDPRQAPNLARFASRGRVFTNAYAPYPWTLPSHLSVMTGYSAEELGVNFEHQRYVGVRSTLGEAFKARGYFTAGFSSNPWLNPGSGYTRGMDHYQYSTNDLDLCRSGLGFFLKLIPNARAPICRWTADELTSAAIRVVQRGPRPYFVSLNYMETHLPLYVPPDCRPPGYKPYDPLVAYPLIDRAHRAGIPIPSENQEHFKENYRIAMRCLDRDLQRLFDAVDESGDGKNTIVVVVSDHGEQFGEHNLSLHANSVYRQVIRVPLALRGPGVSPGTDSQPVSTTWLYGTILDVAGIPASRRAKRLPLTDVIPSNEPVISVHRPPKRERNVPPRIAVDRWSIVSGRYHYILGANGEQELYDYVADPQEATNLAARADLQHMLTEWHDRGRRYHSRYSGTSEDADRLFSLGYLQ